MERWRPSVVVTKHEQFLLERLEKKRKLFGFLRRYRHDIFDDEFQAELDTYRDTGARKEVPPAQMAMALLLRGYFGLSDRDACRDGRHGPAVADSARCVIGADPTPSYQRGLPLPLPLPAITG